MMGHADVLLARGRRDVGGERCAWPGIDAVEIETESGEKVAIYRAHRSGTISHR